MFSASSLYHFVFVNRNDMYFCNSLKMDLQQYLWWKLHEEGFGNVYFMDKQGPTFNIRDLGDRNISLPQNFWGNENRQPNDKALVGMLGSWMSQKNAVVFRLAEFCRMGDYDKTKKRLKNELAKNHKGVVVFVVYPGDEKLFLENADLRQMAESLRRDFTEQDPDSGKALCDHLFAAGHEDCVFWNHHTKDMIKPVVRQAILEDPEKIRFYPAIDEISSGIELLLDEDADISHPEILPDKISTYQLLYDNLKKESSGDSLRRWQKLQDFSKQMDFNEYAANFQIPQILHQVSYTPEGAEKIHQDICQLMKTHSQGRDNMRIHAYACRFMEILRKERDLSDWGSYERTLLALRFCLQWIGTEKGSITEEAIVDITQKFQDCIELSENCHLVQKNLDMMESQKGYGTLSAKLYEQTSMDLYIKTKLLENCSDVLMASVLSLANLATGAKLDEIVAKLDQDMKKIMDDIPKGSMDNSEKTDEAEEKTAENTNSGSTELTKIALDDDELEQYMVSGGAADTLSDPDDWEDFMDGLYEIKLH